MKRKVRLDRHGLPVDPNDWTVEDWRTLWQGIAVIKAIIAHRHKEPLACTDTERQASGPAAVESSRPGNK